MTIIDQRAWMADAACRNMETSTFYPEALGRKHQKSLGGRVSKARVAQATTVCAGCDVRAECAAYAYSTGERYGVWGGLTERDRIISPPAITAVAGRDQRCGTLAGYSAHRRRGEDACPGCKQAATIRMRATRPSRAQAAQA